MHQSDKKCLLFLPTQVFQPHLNLRMTFGTFQRIGGGGGWLAAGQGNQPCDEKDGSFALIPTHPPLERGEGLEIEFCLQWPSSLINSACLLKRPQKPLKYDFC